MIEWLMKAKDTFQDLGGLIEIVITLTTTTISILLWIQKKRRESRITGLAISGSIGDKNDQVGLIIELVNGQPELTYRAIMDSIPHQRGMSKLKKILVNAKSLSNSAAMEKWELAGGFRVDYHYSAADADIRKGRFVSLANNNKMPEDTESVRKYLLNFNESMNSLFSKLGNSGVHTVHVFFHGPVPLNAYIGAKCINKFTVFYYHYVPGRGYYLLGNSDFVKDDMSQAEK